MDEWEKEYAKATKKVKKKSKSLNDERNLFTRLKAYSEEHLRFIKNFEVPFSNNEAERNLRKIKIKLNVSKRFGKLECAKNFAIIKSIIETAKKQKLDIFEVFSEILNGNYDVFINCIIYTDTQGSKKILTRNSCVPFLHPMNSNEFFHIFLNKNAII